MAAPAPRRLSARLEAILALLEPCELLADVGTDHALVPAHAVLRGLAQRAIGVDLREEPLRRAAQTLTRWGLAERVELRRGDGLAALAGERIDTLVLAGLGGETLLGWCRAAPEQVRTPRRLIVQPNRQLAAWRAWAYREGLWLSSENLCEEGGRWFVTCAWGPGAGGPDPAYELGELPPERAFELGPWLVARREPLAARYFDSERRRLAALVRAGRLDVSERWATFEEGCRLLEGR